MSSAEEVWPGTGPEWARSRPWPALQPAALRSTPGPQPGLAPALPLPREQGSLEALQPGLLIWSERQIEATQGASRPRGETQPQGAVEVGGRRGAVCALLPPPRPAAPPLEARSPLPCGGVDALFPVADASPRLSPHFCRQDSLSRWRGPHAQCTWCMQVGHPPLGQREPELRGRETFSSSAGSRGDVGWWPARPHRGQ